VQEKEVVRHDHSVTTGISEAIQTLLPALEEFLRFEHQDLAASEYAQWSDAPDERLPAHGRGAEATLRTLKEVVIPRALRTGAPGFAGWVTTMPTVVPAAAAFAASLAGAPATGRDPEKGWGVASPPPNP
jgi:hypothetical protein